MFISHCFCGGEVTCADWLHCAGNRAVTECYSLPYVRKGNVVSLVDIKFHMGLLLVYKYSLEGQAEIRLVIYGAGRPEKEGMLQHRQWTEKDGPEERSKGNRELRKRRPNMQ